MNGLSTTSLILRLVFGAVTPVTAVICHRCLSELGLLAHLSSCSSIARHVIRAPVGGADAARAVPGALRFAATACPPLSDRPSFVTMATIAVVPCLSPGFTSLGYISRPARFTSPVYDNSPFSTRLHYQLGDAHVLSPRPRSARRLRHPARSPDRQPARRQPASARGGVLPRLWSLAPPLLECRVWSRRNHASRRSL